MAKKLLIDAAQPEEVRIAVVDGDKLEEFDSESSLRKQLKGNIYLAKVIRIEPSLQAAFVEYGGNRHGFLPFSEIHPDYFRIPVSDKEELLAELKAQEEPDDDVIQDEENPTSEEVTEVPEESEREDTEEDSDDLDSEEGLSNQRAINNLRKKGIRYKIQEVLAHRQIMLVQIVKDERGNKGAALTTYLSLPGRYCVLMPNAGHRAGGISRKISDGEDRKRLKDLMKDLEVPEGIGLIVRTAGQDRSKIEIKRDFEYLMRLWSDIRELTMKSVAPVAVYNESDIVNRSIRDIYSKDIEEILIEGEHAYKEARLFMKSLMPSHTKKIQLYKDPNVPLFYKYNVEEHVEKILENIVQLPSGGYLVINQTEALVAVDVNSGKSTRERSIDTTALKTNLEAAEAFAHQMRLRDLGGLVVIDFIDMNDANHISQVERRLKDATKNDRAKIQIGRISQFGLLELSRQRLKPSLMETISVVCPGCKGAGVVRSVESVALRVIRGLESLLIQRKAPKIQVHTPQGVDLYLLNQKRSVISNLESRFNLHIHIAHREDLIQPHFVVDLIDEDSLEVVDFDGDKPIVNANAKESKNQNREARENREGRDNRENRERQPRLQNPRHRNGKPRPNQESTSDESKPMDSQAPTEFVTSGEMDQGSENQGNSDNQNQEGRRGRNRKRHRQRLYRGRNRDNRQENGEQGDRSENIVPMPQGEKPKASDQPQNKEDSSKGKKSKGWLRRLLDA